MTDGWPAANRLAKIALLLALVLAWLCYRPALTGAFQFDDLANLGELANISDGGSALRFILAGEAGPLGRPLALATFAAQSGSWEAGAGRFLQFNILLHLLNAIVLAACVWQLVALLGLGRDRAWTTTALVASVWVLLPLLATASLLVIQRMTTLSALFALLGLLGYLAARRKLEATPSTALLWMSVALGLGTGLAMLSKESGILLPVYVLVLELTILPRPRRLALRYWRLWQAVVLAAPLVVVLGYLITTVPYAEALALRRDFTGGERLLTQAQLLWLYLYKALYGVPHTLGIFQTPPEVVRSLWQPQSLLACGLWLALAGAAIVGRRRWPLFALAVLWFLGGHLLESTTVSLELYFEHRNYLPIIGPLLALAIGLATATDRVRRIGTAVLVVFVIANAYWLYSFAAVWGEPSMASRYWAMRYPDSVRAVTTLATYQLQEEGPQRVLATLDGFLGSHPEHAYLRIQQLNLLCRIAPRHDHSAAVALTRRELPEAAFTYTAGGMLSQLSDASVATDCESVTPETVVELATLLRDNARYRQDAAYNQFHHRLLAAVARRQGDRAATLAHLQAAIDYQPSAELNFMMVTALAEDGEFAAARDFIAAARPLAPRSPLPAANWHRELDELVVYIDELEKLAQ